jgi:hypothetical protein
VGDCEALDEREEQTDFTLFLCIHVNKILTPPNSCARHEFREVLMEKCKCRIKHCEIEMFLYAVLKVTAIVLTILSVWAILISLFDKSCDYYLSLTLDGTVCFLSFFEPFYPLFSGTIIALTLFVALSTYRTGKHVEAVAGLVKIRELLISEENMKIHDFLENANDKILVNNEERKDENIKELLDKENKITKEEYFEYIYFPQNKVNVYNYLGILELSNIYIQTGIISESEFMSQFGYRVENVFENRFLKNIIDIQSKYWQELYDLNCKVSYIRYCKR